MEKIKLKNNILEIVSNGIYSTDDELTVNIIPSNTLSEMESVFTKDNTEKIILLSESGEELKIYNGYTTMKSIMMTKGEQDVVTVVLTKPDIKDIINELSAKLDSLMQYQRITVRDNGNGMYEVAKAEYSADRPVPYVEGMELENNQYYLKDGKVYVYMNGELIEW